MPAKGPPWRRWCAAAPCRSNLELYWRWIRTKEARAFSSPPWARPSSHRTNASAATGEKRGVYFHFHRVICCGVRGGETAFYDGGESVGREPKVTGGREKGCGTPAWEDRRSRKQGKTISSFVPTYTYFPLLVTPFFAAAESCFMAFLLGTNSRRGAASFF